MNKITLGYKEHRITRLSARGQQPRFACFQGQIALYLRGLQLARPCTKHACMGSPWPRFQYLGRGPWDLEPETAQSHSLHFWQMGCFCSQKYFQATPKSVALYVYIRKKPLILFCCSIKTGHNVPCFNRGNYALTQMTVILSFTKLFHRERQQL